ncbi:MAG: flagellar assembly protein FliW [Planctomycetota bacterium]|jgi:flagellar assembly factor FliW|nr:flagellar assembly protein FliW [Planctomycetota bacterium]
MSPQIAEAEGALVRVKTLLRGEIEVPDDQVLTFVEPLVGFEHLSRFVLYQTSEGPLYWLQSAENAEVAFALLAPFEAGLDPDMAIGPQDLADIEVSDPERVAVYTMVVLAKDPKDSRTNLRAPILVSKDGSKAKQVILDDPNLAVQFPLSKLLPPGQAT